MRRIIPFEQRVDAEEWSRYNIRCHTGLRGTMRPQAPEKPPTLTLLCDCYDALERAGTSDDLRAETAKFAQKMGFGHFAYVLTINAPSLKAQQYIINGFPPEWQQRYLSRDYFKVDPVVQRAAGSTLPFAWSCDMFQDGKSEEFWEEARTYGLQAGLSFSVHEQPGVVGLFSLARDRLLDLQGQDLAALIGRAQMFSGLLHQAVARIALPEMLPQQTVALTTRERECLKWAAEGKTAWESGRILGITERTVVFHVNNVIRKLDAANKTQAIVRAVALKLIT